MSGGPGPAAPEIRPRPLAPAGTLAGDFVRGVEGARSLFPDPRPRGDGGAARIPAAAFRVTGEEARERLESVLGGAGRLVTTGQQPVLFGGPLYVLYKALSAVASADRLERETGEPALALFWVGSDDHDWGESGGIRLLDTTNEIREVRLTQPEAHRGRPAGPTPLPGTVQECIAELSQILPPSEFTDEYLELILDTHRPERSLADAFQALLARLLRGRPLALLDAAHPAVKAASAPFLAGSLEEAAAEEGAVRGASDSVRGAGYELQMPVLEGATHVFVDTEEGRERVYRAGDGFLRLGREGPEVPLAEMKRRLEDEPARFSPNVALRPVLEAWLLPVSRAVLGPGEIGYWAQLTGLFQDRGVSMPTPEARASWTVVEDKVDKVLRRFGAQPDAFRDGGRSLREEAVASARPAGVREALEGLRASIGRSLQEVEEAVGDELPGIRASVGKARSRLFGAVQELDGAVDRRVEERQSTLLAQLDKAAVHLYPEGEPQERVLNPLYYLARYDDAFLDAVDRATRRRAGNEEGDGPEDAPADGP